eukprot:comp23758_c0_seq1/m.41122 comp23758_c0_seq1/g.41122  ORF comp23758_c0_seq1/g.41122 comp23758_c0_seq1/m.41122 type:complete len:498 (-) comp23758_c0_seq1:409-1902(-)
MATKIAAKVQGMQVLHGIKKTINNISTQSALTSDPQFNSTLASFKQSLTQAQNIQTAIKGNRQAWDSVRKNMRGTLDGVYESFGDGEGGRARSIAADAIHAVNKWDTLVKDARDGNTSLSGHVARINEAERMLDSYIAYVGIVSKKVQKRETVKGELDYYRNKADQCINSTKQKDQDKLARAETKVEDLQAEFDALSEETYNDMVRGLKLKERIFSCTVAAYLDFQRRSIDAFALFVKTADDCKDVVDSEWPTEEDFAVNPVQKKISPDGTPVGSSSSASLSRTRSRAASNSQRDRDSITDHDAGDFSCNSASSLASQSEGVIRPVRPRAPVLPAATPNDANFIPSRPPPPTSAPLPTTDAEPKVPPRRTLSAMSSAPAAAPRPGSVLGSASADQSSVPTPAPKPTAAVRPRSPPAVAPTNETPKVPAPMPPRPARLGGLFTVQATHDFVGQETGDLGFSKGDQIVVLQVIDDNWYKGSLGGAQGIFPAAFVEKLAA